MTSSRIRNFEKLISDLGYQHSLRAFDLMREQMSATAGFKRESGEDYYYHLVDVSQYLLNAGIRDETVITSALLHDYVEDVSGANHTLVSVMFDIEVADTVMGVTKKPGIDYKTDEVAMREYVDYILNNLKCALVKTSDFVHNFGTLGATRPEKQLRKAIEMETYYFPFLDECAKRYPRYANFFLGAKTTIEPHLRSIKAHHADVQRLEAEIERLKAELASVKGVV